MYDVTYLLTNEQYFMTSKGSDFLPAIGDEIRVINTKLDGTFRITRRIFVLREGPQNPIPVTVYCEYRSRNATHHNKN